MPASRRIRSASHTAFAVFFRCRNSALRHDAIAPAAKKEIAVKKAKAFTVTGAQGKVTFKKTKGNKKITVKANGKVVVKKGLKKGKTYKVKVKVTAKGNANYKSASKTVTLKVKVK